MFQKQPIHHKEISELKFWYLSAIEIIDIQVAQQGCQYHRNPPYKKEKKEVY